MLGSRLNKQHLRRLLSRDPMPPCLFSLSLTEKTVSGTLGWLTARGTSLYVYPKLSRLLREKGQKGQFHSGAAAQRQPWDGQQL